MSGPTHKILRGQLRDKTKCLTDSLAENILLRGALIAVRTDRGPVGCWCPYSDNRIKVQFQGHTFGCLKARAALGVK